MIGKNDVQKIRIAYLGESVKDGTMNVNELSVALMALSNLIGSANNILNNDDSTIEVRLSADVEHGSFEMTFELVHTLAAQIKLLFGDDSLTLKGILGAIGFFSTVSGVTLIQLFRWLKCRKVDKVETIDKDTVKVTVENETREVSILSWKLYNSQKIIQHIEGVLHPLTKEGITDFEIRDFETRKSIEKINENELEYFTGNSYEEINSRQELLLQIVSVSFETNLKWRFFDGENKFYATITDEKFLKSVENGEVAFSKGYSIYAEVETKQQHCNGILQKSEKFITKVLKILNSPS